MRKGTLFILFLLSLPALRAQNNLPSPFEIRTDTILLQFLDNSYWQVLVDKEGNWSLNDVMRPPLSDQFHSRDSIPAGTDTMSTTYWFRFRLKNRMNREARICLDSYFESDDYYVVSANDNSRHYLTGRYIPWKNKDGIKRHNYIPIVLQPGEEVLIYDRGHNQQPGLPTIRFMDIASTDGVLHRDYLDVDSKLVDRSQLVAFFSIGFFLLAAFFNFFFFLTVREKLHLNLALFLLLICLEIFEQLLETSYPKIAQYGGVAVGLGLVFFLYFVRHFFETFRYKKRWDKWLMGLSFLMLLSLVSRLFFPTNQTISLAVRSLVFFINPLCILITFSLFIRSRRHIARSFMIAVLPTLLFLIVSGFSSMALVLKIQLMPALIWFQMNGMNIATITLCWAVLFFTWTLFSRYNQQRKEIAQQAFEKERMAKEKEIERRQLIDQQRVELEKQVEERTAELKSSLENLRSAQSQLIQSEKMASLGELTAGIAHEIQNPLNFVNNFSEVSNELIDEMKQELATGNQQTATEIADDVKQNLEKILHHGKRADAIVKGMLQHSRSSSGQKEPTDINALADEYLRLAYHGLRAKDKSFTASYKTEFDSTVDKINIVSQDVGRVILNLINNAFYVVNEKNQQNLNARFNDPSEGGYEPLVTVKSKKLDGKVELRVIDNGNGIPQKLLDKIFQPFFTTKPTGEGTGLGLSLSYDIITKGHGGILKVETVEGKGSEFIILLPAS